MDLRYLVFSVLLVTSSMLSGCTQPTSDTANGRTTTHLVTIEAINAEGEQVASGESYLPENENGFQAMKEVLGEENLTYVDYGPGLGVLIESINGVEPGEGYFWKLYVNGEESAVGISQVVIGQDTDLRWELTKAEEYTG